ncbi:hypothetical protein SNE40_019128 [Patella caerulea]|uniref:Uncharacterized protein n=1 Tax=Patella caerulea TaxID=87958 RepID=A0AAN8J8Q0_PATCE
MAKVHPYEKDDLGWYSSTYDDVGLMEVGEAEEFQGSSCSIVNKSCLDDELQFLETIKGTTNRSIASPLLYEEDMSTDSS